MKYRRFGRTEIRMPVISAILLEAHELLFDGPQKRLSQLSQS